VFCCSFYFSETICKQPIWSAPIRAFQRLCHDSTLFWVRGMSNLLLWLTGQNADGINKDGDQDTVPFLNVRRISPFT